MLNDAETNGFVESFRSMSEWLEFLLLSEKYGLRDGIKDRSGGVGRCVSSTASYRTDCLYLF